MTTEGNEPNNENCFKKIRSSQNSKNWKKL